MCKPVTSSKRRCAALAGALVLALCAAPARSRGQAAVETAGAASTSAAMASSAPKVLPKSLPNLATGGNSPSLPVSRGPSTDETNRRSLEKRAGKDAAKLLLQSVPSEAQISIDGNFVGRTPLLLIVPPGKYKVEMRGHQQESGERLIELQPNETQRVALTLALHYSASATARPRACFILCARRNGGDSSFLRAIAVTCFGRQLVRACRLRNTLLSMRR